MVEIIRRCPQNGQNRQKLVEKLFSSRSVVSYVDAAIDAAIDGGQWGPEGHSGTVLSPLDRPNASGEKRFLVAMEAIFAQFCLSRNCGKLKDFSILEFKIAQTTRDITKQTKIYLRNMLFYRFPEGFGHRMKTR